MSHADHTAVGEPRATVIRPRRGWIAVGHGELWRARELVAFLIWRDLVVRYKQAVLGVAWVVIQPVITMVMYTIVFGYIAKMSSDGVPYPVFSFVALVPWQFFASGVQRCGFSLVANVNLFTKVYFPRLALPISAVLAGLVDLAMACVVLAALLAFYHVVPTANVVWLPLFVLLAVAATLAVGIWLSALNVMYRDVGHAIPLILQMWMFASPVVYSADLVPGPWRWVYALNPMAGVIQGFRWAILGSQAPGGMVAVGAAVTVVLLVTGLAFFKSAERVFVDVV